VRSEKGKKKENDRIKKIKRTLIEERRVID
jgi:hypothetical protein